MAGSSPFEPRLVKYINQYFESTDSFGIAYRLKMSAFRGHYLDVLVDSVNRAHYLGVECKSISPPQDPDEPYRKLYFSDFSVDKKGEHQITRISKFLKKSGRFGILAIELRKGQGHGMNDIYFIPFHHVESWYEAGVKGIDPAALDGNYPQLKKEKGTLNWDWVMSALRQL